MLAPDLRARAEDLVARYPVGRSALLPLLHLVQHADGYVTDDGVAECAELLGLTKAEVAAVATFYTMYKRAPLGEHLVSVCTNFSCKVRGAQEVYERLSAKLAVSHNQTTADGRFTLEHAECLGNCEGAPVVSVDYLNYECLTPDTAEQLVDRIMAGDVPPPTRGMVPPGVRAVSYRLAGLGPWPGSEPVGRAPHDAVRDRPDSEAVPDRDQAEADLHDAGVHPEQAEEEAGPHEREAPPVSEEAPAEAEATEPRDEGGPEATGPHDDGEAGTSAAPSGEGS